MKTNAVCLPKKRNGTNPPPLQHTGRLPTNSGKVPSVSSISDLFLTHSSILHAMSILRRNPLKPSILRTKPTIPSRPTTATTNKQAALFWRVAPLVAVAGCHCLQAPRACPQGLPCSFHVSLQTSASLHALALPNLRLTPAHLKCRVERARLVLPMLATHEHEAEARAGLPRKEPTLRPPFSHHAIMGKHGSAAALAPGHRLLSHFLQYRRRSLVDSFVASSRSNGEADKGRGRMTCHGQHGPFRHLSVDNVPDLPHTS
ncbi:hypothetical protein LY76DRAFT_589239 [Colletotrichum caudatum]|nr:hypothetical protein LY76DRAFT_589239 [Colletotrichum caudatum]